MLIMLLGLVPQFTLQVLFSQREHLTPVRVTPTHFKDGQDACLGLVGSRDSEMGLESRPSLELIFTKVKL